MRRSNPSSKIISDINITPLTDVMLVLLIIFMVTATFFIAEPAMHVTLPSATTGKVDLPEENEITITISKNSEVEVEGERVEVSELVGALLAAAKKGGRVVRIRADEEARYGLVVWAMDAARSVGLRSISLATEPREEERELREK